MALADGPASLDSDMMLWRDGISRDRDHLLHQAEQRALGMARFYAVQTQDVQLSMCSRAGKQGGIPWYVHGSRLVQPRALPRNAAALQNLANGLNGVTASPRCLLSISGR